MFVLHPSSRCDICLEAFSWETEMAPYAIPCGHVFCRTCLEAVVPPKCPLCRKHYDPTRLKKLHVDRPDGADTDPKEGEFLQRIALSFDAPEEHFRELVQEVDAWLQGKPSESCLPIRKARKALDKYQDLRFLGIENKREISRMKSDLTEMKRIMDAEKDRSEKVEENLLQEKDALQIQVDAYKAELEQLRTEIQRRALKNPLPPPPQPVSFPRYPPFDSKSIPSASGPVTGWFNSNGQPLLPSTNGVSYVHPRNLWPEDDRENQSNILNESNGAKRDRKGKNTDANAADLYRSVYISNPLPNLPVRPMTAAPAHHTVNGSGSGPSSSSTSLPLDNSKAKAGIIPGASNNSNFAPPDPEAEKERGFFAFRSPKKSPRDLGVPKAPPDPMREAMDPYTLTATLLPEYMNGFMEGYSSAVQTAGMHNAVPSSSSRPHQEPEASASSSSGQPSSSSERRERKRRERDGERDRDKERERDRRRERHRERAANGDREHDRHQEREQRRERRASNAHRRPTTENLPEAIALLSSGPTRTTPGEDSQSSNSRGSRPHRRRTSEADTAQRTQVQAQATLASILSDNPTRHRRTSTSRPSTTAPSAQPQPVIPPPQQPSAQPTRSVAVPPPGPMPIAQPTPRLAAQPPPLPLVEPTSNAEPVVGSPASRHTVQSVDTWGTVERTPASRHSVQSIADTWGTVSPNSLASLNLQAFPLYQPQRQQVAPYRSPERPTPQPVESSDEEEEESDEDEATLVSTPHYQHPTRTLPATAISNTHPPPRAPEQATPRPHTAYPQSASAVLQSSHPQPPYSQPHGTRHTQTISVTQHYQNPTTMYAQRPQSAAVPPSNNNHNARNRSHDARPHRGHTHSHSQSQPHSQFQLQPHSQPHSRSQSRASHVATDGHGDVRIRRLSTSAAVTYASSSLSSLSLHSLHAPPPLHSAPAARPASNQRDNEEEEEDEDSDDDSEEEEEERANGNALGLEHSATTHGGNVFGLQHGFHASTGHAGNALGLAISQPPAGGPVPISAPTPRVSNRAFLNSFSHENYTK